MTDAGSQIAADWPKRYVDGSLRFVERGRTREGGVDCWGLGALVFREQLGIVLPDYSSDYASTADHAQMVRVIAREKTIDWAPVWESRTLQGLKRVSGALEAPPKGAVRPFDFLLLPIEGDPCHIGIACGGTEFLHIRAGEDATVADWSAMKWAARMARGGAYRHRALAEAV
jgi:cell wall-associated NlpC family hydrolase